MTENYICSLRRVLMLQETNTEAVFDTMVVIKKKVCENHLSVSTLTITWYYLHINMSFLILPRDFTSFGDKVGTHGIVNTFSIARSVSL